MFKALEDSVMDIRVTGEYNWRAAIQELTYTAGYICPVSLE